MPPLEPPRKLVKAAPVTEQISARKNRLQRGISALRVALDCLQMDVQQRAHFLLVIHQQEKLLAISSAAPAAPKAKKPDPKAPKKRLSREEQARRTLEGQLKKQQRAELDKRLRMIEAKKRAEIEAIHRKSGYSDFMRRAPGSYEGGKK